MDERLRPADAAPVSDALLRGPPRDQSDRANRGCGPGWGPAQLAGTETAARAATAGGECSTGAVVEARVQPAGTRARGTLGPCCLPPVFRTAPRPPRRWRPGRRTAAGARLLDEPLVATWPGRGVSRIPLLPFRGPLLFSWLLPRRTRPSGEPRTPAPGPTRGGRTTPGPGTGPGRPQVGPMSGAAGSSSGREMRTLAAQRIRCGRRPAAGNAAASFSRPNGGPVPAAWPPQSRRPAWTARGLPSACGPMIGPAERLPPPEPSGSGWRLRHIRGLIEAASSGVPADGLAIMMPAARRSGQERSRTSRWRCSPRRGECAFQGGRRGARRWRSPPLLAACRTQGATRETRLMAGLLPVGRPGPRGGRPRAAVPARRGRP